MMRSLAVLLVVAMLPENIGAFTHASTWKAPTFLAAQDVAVLLAADTHQEPVNEDKVKPKIGHGIILAVCGSIIFCAGVAVMYGTLRSNQEARLMTGDDALEATATVSSTKRYTTTSQDSDGNTSIQYHYEASYWFEAVRQDGMRCRITVTNREVGAKVLESCREGSRIRVRYLSDDPQHCRLTQAAENDMSSSSGCFLVVKLLFGSIFAASGLWLGVVLPTKVAGLHGFLVCGCVFCLVAAAYICVFPRMDSEMSGVKGASLEKLGMQEPSSELGNISGTWSLQSDTGTFEYKFAMANEKAFSLTVQGRLEGLEWDPEYQARFTDDRTMNWEDNQGKAFRVILETSQKFHGCAKATDGSEMAFVGFRKN